MDADLVRARVQVFGPSAVRTTRSAGAPAAVGHERVVGEAYSGWPMPTPSRSRSGCPASIRSVGGSPGWNANRASGRSPRRVRLTAEGHRVQAAAGSAADTTRIGTTAGPTGRLERGVDVLREAAALFADSRHGCASRARGSASASQVSDSSSDQPRSSVRTK